MCVWKTRARSLHCAEEPSSQITIHPVLWIVRDTFELAARNRPPLKVVIATEMLKSGHVRWEWRAGEESLK